MLPILRTRSSPPGRSPRWRGRRLGHNGPMIERLSNLAVARLLAEIAQSLELAGEDGHRPRAYRRAARAVAIYPEPLELLAAEGRLRDVPGVGPALASADRRVSGDGRDGASTRGWSPSIRQGWRHCFGHTASARPACRSLHAALGAVDLDAIERAGREGRLAAAIGPKRAQELIDQIPGTTQSDSPAATQVGLGPRRPGDRADRRVRWRRRCESSWRVRVAACARWSSAAWIWSPSPERRVRRALLDALTTLPTVAEATERGPSSATVRLYDGVARAPARGRAWRVGRRTAVAHRLGRAPAAAGCTGDGQGLAAHSVWSARGVPGWRLDR